MPNQWYVKHQETGGVRGPLSDQELIKLAAAKELQPETLVSVGEPKKWRPASRVSNLFDLARQKIATGESNSGNTTSGNAARTTPKTSDVAALQDRLSANEVRTSELINLVKRLGQATQNQGSLRTETDSLKNELVVLIQRVQELEEQKAHRDREFADVVAKLAHQTMLNTSLAAILQSQRQQTQTELDRLTSGQVELRQWFEANTNQIETLPLQFALKQDVIELAKQVQQVQDMRSQGDQKLDEMAASIEKHVERNEELKAVLQSQREQTQTELDRLTNEQVGLKQYLVSNINLITTLPQHFASKQDVIQLATQVQQFDDTRSHGDQKLADMAVKIDRQATRNDELFEELRNQRQQSQTGFARLTSEQIELRQCLDANTTRIESNPHLNAANQEIGDLAIQVQKLAVNQAQHDQAFAAITTAIDGQTKLHQQLSEELRGCQQTLQADFDRFTSEQAKLSQSIAVNAKSLQQMSIRCTALASTLNQFVANSPLNNVSPNGSETDRYQNAIDQLKSLESQMISLTEKTGVVEAAYESLREQISARQDRVTITPLNEGPEATSRATDFFSNDLLPSSLSNAGDYAEEPVDAIADSDDLDPNQLLRTQQATKGITSQVIQPQLKDSSEDLRREMGCQASGENIDLQNFDDEIRQVDSVITPAENWTSVSFEDDETASVRQAVETDARESEVELPPGSIAFEAPEVAITLTSAQNNSVVDLTGPIPGLSPGGADFSFGTKSLTASTVTARKPEAGSALSESADVDELQKLHELLQTHFTRLYDDRQRHGLPTYLLEHELTREEVKYCAGLISDSLHRFSLSRARWWWSARYLPLLVVAVEEGYVYQGNGTDYWPGLERRLSFSFDHDSRRSISRLFEQASEEYGVAMPPETPWHRQYRHIAWPITNAVLPLDMRVPFAEALTRLPCLTESYDDDRLMELLRAVSVASGSIRYDNWLKSEIIPAQLARFVLEDDHEAKFLSSATLMRIRADLLAEETARRAIAEARTKQERKPSRGSADSRTLAKPFRESTPNDQSINCPLSLRRTDESNFQLQVTLPSPPQACRSWLQHQLRTRKWEPTQWAIPSMPVIGISSLLFGVPCGIDIRSMLRRESGVRFLSGWESLDPGDEVIDWLYRIDVSPVLPLVFRPDADLRSANQHLANYVSAGQLLWVLIREAEGVPDCAIQLGKCGTLAVLQVDPSHEQVAQWLVSLGIKVGSRIQWRRSHDPCHFVMGRRVCAVGNFFAYELVALNGDSNVKIGCTTPGGAESVVAVEAEGIFGWSIDEPGEYEFSIWSADRLLDKISFNATPGSLRIAPVFQIELLGGEATVTSLTQSQLKIEITARRAIRNAVVTVELGAAKVQMTADEFPLRIAMHDEVWAQLLTDQNRKAIAMGADLLLSVNIAGIESKRWRLENEITDVKWEIDSLGQATAATDDRVMEVVQLGLDTIPPAAATDQSLASMFVVKQSERLCFEMGTIVNSRKTSSLPTNPQLAAKLERRLVASHQKNVALQELMELYIAIVTSRASHGVAAFHQDNYKTAVKTRIAELILGKQWLARQTKQEVTFSDPQAILIDCAIERQAGFEKCLHETESISHEFRLLAASNVKAVLPRSWWNLKASHFTADHAARLDRCIGSVYHQLAQTKEDTVTRDLWLQVDPFTDIDIWLRVLHEASRRLQGGYLAEMVLPSELGEAILHENLIDMSAAEVSVRLSFWLKQHLRFHWSYAAWTHDRLEIALLLFERPQLLRRKDWTETAELLLKDRFVARAIAFTSWRRLQFEVLGE